MTTVALILLAVLLFGLMFLGLPVAFCMIGSGLIVAYYLGGLPALYLGVSQLWSLSSTEMYLAIPLFVLMACALQYSGVADDIFEAIYRLFRFVRASLSVVTILTCTVIAAMTGLGATGTLTMGMLAYPQMRARGYANEISLGVIPPSGALGPLIPPSVVMIILGGLTGVSVGKLFAGGLIPGLLMSVLFILWVQLRVRMKPSLAPMPVKGEVLPARKMRSLVAWLAASAALIFGVLGSVWLGVATPTEAGAVGAVGALLIGAVKGKLKWRVLKQMSTESLKITIMVFWLLTGGLILASVITTSGVSSQLVDLITRMNLSPIGVVAIIMFIGILFGMIIDALAIIMIIIPVVWPLILITQVDPLWFLVAFTMVLVTGYVTPPYGMNLFYLKGLMPPDVTIGDIYKSVAPYCVLMAIATAIVVAFPALATWLPTLMMK